MERNKKDLIGDIVNAFEKYAGNKAFIINDIVYTYRQLAATVCQISALIDKRKEKVIGIIAEDRLETYASILAVLISGKTYVILHPAYPEQRNKRIAGIAGLHIVLYAENKVLSNPEKRSLEFIQTSELPSTGTSLLPTETDEKENAYIIFTSGSTGEPKGVPISRKNLNAFYDAYGRLG